MGIEPRVAAVAASGVLGLIGQCGGDPNRILGAARLDPSDVLNPATSLDLARYCDLFEQAARQTGLGSFGLRFGTGYLLENMGPLGALILNSATLGEALRHLCAYFPAVQEHSTLALAGEGDLVALKYRITDGRIAQRRQDAELTIGIFSNIFQRCLGPFWTPEEIHFEHLRGADLAEIRALLRAPVYFAAPGNAILFRRADLAAPMPGADASRIPALRAALHASVEAARPEDFIGQVLSEIRLGLADGDASIERIASRLGLSRAGLYRRLAREQQNFSTLTERTRRALAEFYVSQPGIPFTELAPLLGYSELSAFSRAFTRWTGISPARYRLERTAHCA
jgi:AraC-like DNA-binding protein